VLEAEGSLIPGTWVRVEAALTTTGRASTVRWCGSGKRDGKVYVRNQRLNASQDETTSSNLTDLGWVATRTRQRCRGTLESGDVVGSEAVVNACGVAAARLQGHSWAPTPLKGSRMNVGTIRMVPPRCPARAEGGKTCRPSMLSGWDGGSVVVRAGESPAHGEGTQCDRSINAERGDRW
jgi:hypothetical protein